MDSIEITAATVDEAIRQALEQLGAEADDVAIEVLTTPRAGVLGLGARQARVRVTRRAPEAATSGVMSPPPAPPPRPRPVTPPPPPRPTAPPPPPPAPAFKP
ncbi:MAG TPA: Jag N-terminal domain-containing protein, partial [Candidatus Binataceae bacterium]|nr:Jag N-terminal domain-containing protein [Candidatus Binataceae bacterium]